MKQATGNILDFILNVDAVCVTTCGIVKNLAPGVPALVMGAGIAKQFAEFFSQRNGWQGFDDEGDLQVSLGASVRYSGNEVHLVPMHREIKPERLADEDIFAYITRCSNSDLGYEKVNVVSFPTKEHYNDPSTLGLIERSARQLVELANTRKWKTILLPRPGVGLGKLKWEDVEPLLESILDDRFIVVAQSN